MMNFKQQPLWQYLAPLKTDVVNIALLSCVANLLMLAPTIYMLQLYDRVMLSKNELTLITVTLLIAFFMVAMAFAEWLRSVITIKAGVKFDQSLNRKLFNQAFERIFTANKKNSHEAMQDLTNIRQLMTSNGLFAFFDMPWTLIYVAVLFILSPALGWLAILFCAIQFGLGIWNQVSTDAPLKATMSIHHDNQQFLSSKVRNLETMHVMGILPQLYKRWQNLQHTANHISGNAIRVQSRNQHLNKLTRYSMQSLMLAAAALLAVKGEISIGSMIASNVLIGRALQPFDIIVSTWKQYIQAKDSMRRLNGILMPSFEASRFNEKEINRRNPTIQGEITLKNLSVTLSQTQKKLLHQLNAISSPGRYSPLWGLPVPAKQPWRVAWQA